MQAQSFYLSPTIFALDFINQSKRLHDDAIEAKAIKLHNSLLEARTAMNAMAHDNKGTNHND